MELSLPFNDRYLPNSAQEGSIVSRDELVALSDIQALRYFLDIFLGRAAKAIMN
jgi:hypothetical protein